MKLNHIILIVILLLSYSCLHLEVLEDCDTVALFEMQKDPNCAPPCAVTFIDKSKGRIDSRRWILGDGSPDILDSTSFTHTYDSAGRYTVKLIVSSTGCPDEDIDDTCNIGGLPEAIITVDRDSCTVGNCLLTFKSSSVNYTTLIWKFPNSIVTNLEEVPYDFTVRPDTFQVTLTAKNGSYEETTSVTIYVNPITFATQQSISTNNFDKIYWIEELSNGDFFVVGNNKERTYYANITREGMLIPGSKKVVDFLGPAFTEREVFDCHKVGGEIVLTGRTLLSTASTNEAYLVAFNSGLSPSAEKSHFDSSGGGEEFSDDISVSNSGGFVMSGRKSGNAPTGMFFVELDNSFDKKRSFIQFPGNSFNRAYGISKTSSGYAVIGLALNGGSFEGVFFQMNNSFLVNAASIQYFGNFIPTEIISVDSSSDFILLGNDGATSVIKKLNSAGGQIWEAKFGNAHLIKGTIARNNKLALVGNADVNGKKSPILKILNLDTGILECEEVYTQSDPAQFYSISTTKDDGYVMGGTQETASGEQALIIRTRKNGKL